MLLVTADTKLNPGQTIFNYLLTDLEGKGDKKGTIRVNLERIKEVPHITEGGYANLAGEDSQDISILGPDGVETTFVLYHNPQDSIGHVDVFVLEERQTKFVSKKKEMQWWMLVLPIIAVAFVLFGTEVTITLAGKENALWIMSTVLVFIFILFTIICWKTK